MVQVVAAVESDVPRCLEIRRAAFAHAAPLAYSEAQVADLLARDESSNMMSMIAASQMFVAKKDGRVVGCGGWQGVNVYNLYVEPSAMRQHVGTALLRAIEAQFVEKSGGSTLLVDAGLYTKAFYEACGYAVVAEAISSDGLAYLEMKKEF